jgi:hypothetical protein
MDDVEIVEPLPQVLQLQSLQYGGHPGCDAPILPFQRRETRVIADAR